MIRRPSASRRRFLASGCAALAAALAPRRARAVRRLNALVPCDHADARLLRPFETAFDVRVNAATYRGTDAALARLDDSPPDDWDVLVVDMADVSRVAADGRLAALDPAKLPWDDVFPELRGPALPSGGGAPRAVPEKFGYHAVAYAADRVDPADMRRISVLWDDAYAGRVAVYDDPVAVTALVGLGLGIRPAELTPSTLAQVRETLLEIKKRAALVGDAAAVRNALVGGDADIIAGGGAFAVAGLKAENPGLDWVVPDDGGVRWGQAIAVLAASPQKGLATEFAKYLLSPEGQGLLATSACYWALPANRRAVLTPAVEAALRWTEQADFLARSSAPLDPGPELDRAIREVWAEFREAAP